MNRINLSDGELAALAARIQQNYDYDDRSGKLVNRKTGRTVKGKQIMGVTPSYNSILTPHLTQNKQYFY